MSSAALIARGDKAALRAAEHYHEAGAQGRMLQRTWDRATLEMKAHFIDVNLAEIASLLAAQRRRAVTAAADRAVL
jgi:hypothetical protein